MASSDLVSLLYLQGAPVNEVLAAFHALCCSTIISDGCRSASTDKKTNEGSGDDAQHGLIEATRVVNQRKFLSLTVGNPVSLRFPLRKGYSSACIKRYMVECSATIQQRQRPRGSAAAPHNKADHRDADDVEEAEEEEIEHDSDLLEWYAGEQASVGVSQVHDMSFKSLYWALHPDKDDARNGDDTAATSSSSAWVHVCVGGQFINVGLSLWPSALILVELVRKWITGEEEEEEEPAGEKKKIAVSVNWLFRPRTDVATDNDNDNNNSRAENSRVDEPIRLVELGSGIGLTGIALHRFLSLLSRQGATGKIGTRNGIHHSHHNYAPSVRGVQSVLTDYQEPILENMRANLKANGSLSTATTIPSPNDGDDRDAASSSPSPSRPCCSCDVALLDWTEANESFWTRWHPDVIVAADCIYDVDVIEGLTKQLERGLLAGGRHSCALVVQTHRQASTMHHFFQHASRFADVESFRCEVGGVNGSLKLIPVESDDQQPQEGVDAKNNESGTCASGDDDPRCSAFVNGMFVEMIQLIRVHRLTLKRGF